MKKTINPLVLLSVVFVCILVLFGGSFFMAIKKTPTKYPQYSYHIQPFSFTIHTIASHKTRRHFQINEYAVVAHRHDSTLFAKK